MHWKVRWYYLRMKEKLEVKIAWLIPRKIAMWCAIRVAAHATTGKWGMESPSELTVMDALKRWDEANDEPTDTLQDSGGYVSSSNSRSGVSDRLDNGSGRIQAC